MAMQVDIAFDSGLEPSEFLRRRIEAEARKLERVHARLMGLRVVVSGPSGRRRHGDLYSVHLRVLTPGDEDIIIGRNPDADHAHEDPYVAVRDAFMAARRKLRERRLKRDGQVKTHAPATAGRVVSLNPDGFGFIEIDGGPEVYFHRNALTNETFDRLTAGTVVRISMSETDGRSQASTVHVLASP
jgi:cold shock CspA family protein